MGQKISSRITKDGKVIFCETRSHSMNIAQLMGYFLVLSLAFVTHLSDPAERC